METKLTGKQWCDFLEIELLTLLEGFDTFEYFYRQPIDRQEFLDRALKCKCKAKEGLSLVEIRSKKSEFLKKVSSPPTYSIKRTSFFVDPALEIQANNDINDLGSEYLLEGATNLYNGHYRLWYKKFQDDKLQQIDLPIKKEDKFKDTQKIPTKAYLNIFYDKSYNSNVDYAKNLEKPHPNDKFFLFERRY